MELQIAIIIIALLIVCIIVMYNSLVKSKQKVKNGWSQIEVQLQKRFDLIPNLVETVKGYANHESQTLEKITELRSSWENATSVDEKVKIGNASTNALKTIIASFESYPDLKANQNFLELQNQLNDIENKIAFSRQFYNDTATMYNTKVHLFPSNIIAGIFKFTDEPLFIVESDEAKKNVKVNF